MYIHTSYNSSYVVSVQITCNMNSFSWRLLASILIYRYNITPDPLANDIKYIYITFNLQQQSIWSNNLNGLLQYRVAENAKVWLILPLRMSSIVRLNNKINIKILLTETDNTLLLYFIDHIVCYKNILNFKICAKRKYYRK